MGFVRLSSLAAVLALAAFAPSAVAGSLCAELLTQEQIIDENRFVTSRAFKDYLAYMGPGFREALIKLRADGHWVDMGAGEAIAVMEYLIVADARFPSANQRARVTAVSVRRPEKKMNKKLEKQALETGKYKYLDGRYVEQIPVEEFGQVDLITDFYGPFAYAMNPVRVLNAYLKMLKIGGSVYLVEGGRSTVHDRSASHSGSIEYSFGNWLQAIKAPGVEIEPGKFPMRITKLAEDAAIPELELFQFKASSPPYREYRRPTLPRTDQR